MSIHTSQHLLSAILETHLSLPTLSWSMQPYPSIEPAYVELPRALTPEEAMEIERLCGEAIKQCKKIWVDFTIQGDDVGKENIGAGSVGTREMRGLPKDYDGVRAHRTFSGILRRVTNCVSDRASFDTSTFRTLIVTPAVVLSLQTHLFYHSYMSFPQLFPTRRSRLQLSFTSCLAPEPSSLCNRHLAPFLLRQRRSDTAELTWWRGLREQK